MQTLEYQLQALFAALIGVIVFQIQSYLRSRKNQRRIDAAENEVRAHRESVEQQTQALVNKFAQDSLERIDRLIATLAQERKEHNIERQEWREDRAEWKQERELRDKQIATLEDAHRSIKLELEATRRELERVRAESSERETVIREQSATIQAQEVKIRQHEETIFQLQLRVKSLEDLNAELERLRNEALAAVAPSALDTAPRDNTKLMIEAKRKHATDEHPKADNITPFPDEPTGDKPA